MTRDEMVAKYNENVAKRDCYKEKITANSSTKTSVVSYFENCMSYTTEMQAYEDKSNFFSELYERNATRHSQSKLDEIVALFDAVDTHLAAKVTEFQGEINYWDAEIKKYDEEQARKRAEEEARRQQEEAANSEG